MAQNTKQLTRIYDLKILGGDTTLKTLNNITKSLADQVKAMELLKKAAAGAVDPAELAKINAQIKESTLEQQRLKLELKEARNEQLLLNTAKIQASNADKKQQQSTEALEGSYKAIIAQMKILRPLIQNANKDSIINFNGQDISFADAIAEFKKLSAAEQDFRRQFSKDGLLVGEYTSGIIKAFRQSGLDEVIRNQLQKAKTELRTLDQNFDQLKKELNDVGSAGARSFQSIEKEMIENRNEANKLRASVVSIESEMQNVGGVGAQLCSSLKKGFADVQRTIGSVVAGYIGLNAAINKGVQLVGDAKQISDSVSDIELNLGKATGGADALVESLRKINTRTTSQGLLQIADSALKAGTAEENILSVTEAIDKVKVAFGKDFGSVEEGTDTFAKLISIFFEDKEITGDRILKIGNAIRALANETTATVPFINDFNGRMAGLKQIFKDFELSQSIGLAAGFEEFKQSSEVASTVLVKVLPKLASDTEKFAKIVGISTSSFNELINRNPAEALLQVSEALVKSGGDQKQLQDIFNQTGLSAEQMDAAITKAAGGGVTQISESFADAELGAGRITTILATLGGKADTFRERIARAGVTIGETGSITDAFNRKNDNLAGTLDKISKKFQDAAGSKGFQLALTLLGGTIAFIVGNIGTLITILGVLAVGWALQNQHMLLLHARLYAYNISLYAMRAGLFILNIAQQAYNITLGLYAGIVSRATAATGLMGLAMKALPFGLLLTVVGVVVATFRAFGETLRGNAAELQRLAIQQQINADISKRVVESTQDEITKINTLTSVIRDNKASLEVRKKALEDLIAINPEYLKGLTLENIATKEGTKLINDYITALKSKAAFEAASAIQGEKIKEDLSLLLVEQKLQQRVSSGKGTELDDLTDEEKEFVGKARKSFAFTASVTDLFTGGSAADEALAAVRARRAALDIEITETTNLVKSKYIAQGNEFSKLATGNDAAPTYVGRTVEAIRADLQKANEDWGKAVVGSKAKTELAKKIKALEAELKAASSDIEKTSARSTSGSRLSGDQKDQLKLIESNRKLALADEETRILELKKLNRFSLDEEEKYIENVEAINLKYLKQKVEYLQGKKKLNAEEKETLAEFIKEISTIELKSQEDIETLNKKRFERRSRELENDRDEKIREAEQRKNIVDNDPTSTQEEKLRVQLQFLKSQLDAQQQFDSQMIALEVLFGIDNVREANKRKDQLEAINRQIQKTAYEIVKQGLADQLRLIEDQRNLSENKSKSETAEKATAILADKKLSPREVANKLKRLELDETKRLLQEEVEANKKALAAVIGARLIGYATDKEVSEARRKLRESEVAAAKYQYENERTIFQKLTDGLRDSYNNITGFFTRLGKSKEQRKAARKEQEDEEEAAINKAKEIIGESIENAKQAYFAQQIQNIEDQKQVNIERLNIEEQQVLKTAQSESEKEGIRRRFESRRKAEEKKANEEKKQVALKQASIDFALAVVKTLAAYPFPFSLIPVAALGVAYALQRSAIQNQKFEKGGRVPTKTGGDITGPSHAHGGVPFNYEAEGGEAYVINKRSIASTRKLTVTGTPRQIASAINEYGGGHSFAGGAFVRKLEYGGTLGRNLQAPQYDGDAKQAVNRAAYSSAYADGDAKQAVNRMAVQIQELKRLVELQYATISAVDKKKVQVVAHEVDTTNNNIKKAEAVGTIG